MPEEIFDVCDADDNVVGQAPRSVVHARGLLHRAVHIWVFNSRGQLLIHRRSATKDEFPRCFTSSASGHLAAGEAYAEAAVRELLEELGLSAMLEYLATFPAAPQTANEHTVLFRAVCDDLPTPDPQEIESIEYVDPTELAAQVAAEPQQFSPPFRVLLDWYQSQRA